MNKRRWLRRSAVLAHGLLLALLTAWRATWLVGDALFPARERQHVQVDLALISPDDGLELSASAMAFFEDGEYPDTGYLIRWLNLIDREPESESVTKSFDLSPDQSDVQALMEFINELAPNELGDERLRSLAESLYELSDRLHGQDAILQWGFDSGSTMMLAGPWVVHYSYYRYLPGHTVGPRIALIAFTGITVFIIGGALSISRCIRAHPS